MTQSGASQMVHQLEERLGFKLLDRSKRPFVLTDEGKVYYSGCREIVERFIALESQVRSMHEEIAGRVHVASIYSVGLSLMKHFVHEFSRAFPKAAVKLDYAHPDRVYEMVAEDQADVGLVSYPKASRTVEATIWREEPMALALAPDHPLASRDRISIQTVDGLDAVGFTEELRIRRETDKALAAVGVTLRAAVEFDNIETLKRAIEINSGVSILPEPTIRREVAAGTLAMIRFDDFKLTRPVGIIRRKGKALNPMACKFVEMLLATSDPQLEPLENGVDDAAVVSRVVTADSVADSEKSPSQKTA